MSEQSFTLQANRPTNAAAQQLSTSMSQVVDRWVTAILYRAVSYADHGSNTIGESAGLQHGSKSTTPHLLPEHRAPISPLPPGSLDRGRLLTVTVVAMLNSLTTPYDLLRSPL